MLQGTNFAKTKVFAKAKIQRRHSWIYPVPLIDPTEENVAYLRRVIDERHIAPTQYWAMNDLLGVKEPIRSALHSFLVDLWMYQTDPYSTTDLDWLWDNITCPSFAATYKKYVAAAQDTLFKKEYLVPPEREFSAVPIRAIGQVYRVDALFNWRPPEFDIREVVDLDVEQDPETLYSFRMRCREYLSRLPTVLLAKEIPFESFIRENEHKCLEGSQFFQEPPVPVMTRGRTRIIGIPRSLDEARSAILESYNSLTTLRWINANVRRLLSPDPRACTRSTLKTMQHDLQHLWQVGWTPARKDKSFRAERMKSDLIAYCRDFKKEGLTKPRNLLSIMMEELYEATHWECFRRTHFFDIWEVEYKGVSWCPKRGHGLGMANDLTSLMQVIIDEMNTEPKYASRYFNDDAVVMLSKATANRYIHNDLLICSKLGLLVKREKTFTSDEGFNFCEQYVHRRNKYVNNKSQFYRQALGNGFKAINASHARSMIGGLPLNFYEVKDLIWYWGFILYPDEHSKDETFGGWSSANSLGICEAFSRRGDDNLDRIESAALLAYEETDFRPIPWNKTRKRSNRALYLTKDAEINPSHYEMRYRDLFRAQLNPKENVRAWNSFEARLKRSFKKHLKDPPISVREAKDLVSRTRDVYPFLGEQTVEVREADPLDIIEGTDPRSLTLWDFNALSIKDDKTKFVGHGAWSVPGDPYYLKARCASAEDFFTWRNPWGMRYLFHLRYRRFSKGPYICPEELKPYRVLDLCKVSGDDIKFLYQSPTADELQMIISSPGLGKLRDNFSYLLLFYFEKYRRELEATTKEMRRRLRLLDIEPRVDCFQDGLEDDFDNDFVKLSNELYYGEVEIEPIPEYDNSYILGDNPLEYFDEDDVLERALEQLAADDWSADDLM